MGRHCPGVLEGFGGAADEEVGVCEDQAKSRWRGGVTFTEEETSVPQKAQGPSRPRGKLIQKQDRIGSSPVQSNMACSAGGAPWHDLLGAPFEFELTHPKWCSMLVSQVLRGRCSFSSFVASSLKVPRSSSVSSLPMFPIPVPPGTHFDGMTEHILEDEKEDSS